MDDQVRTQVLLVALMLSVTFILLVHGYHLVLHLLSLIPSTIPLGLLVQTLGSLGPRSVLRLILARLSWNSGPQLSYYPHCVVLKLERNQKLFLPYDQNASKLMTQARALLYDDDGSLIRNITQPPGFPYLLTAQELGGSYIEVRVGTRKATYTSTPPYLLRELLA